MIGDRTAALLDDARVDGELLALADPPTELLTAVRRRPTLQLASLVQAGLRALTEHTSDPVSCPRCATLAPAVLASRWPRHHRQLLQAAVAAVTVLRNRAATGIDDYELARGDATRRATIGGHLQRALAPYCAAATLERLQPTRSLEHLLDRCGVIGQQRARARHAASAVIDLLLELPADQPVPLLGDYADHLQEAAARLLAPAPPAPKLLVITGSGRPGRAQAAVALAMAAATAGVGVQLTQAGQLLTRIAGNHLVVLAGLRADLLIIDGVDWLEHRRLAPVAWLRQDAGLPTAITTGLDPHGRAQLGWLPATATVVSLDPHPRPGQTANAGGGSAA
jgi:hypothetical protein